MGGVALSQSFARWSIRCSGIRFTISPAPLRANVEHLWPGGAARNHHLSRREPAGVLFLRRFGGRSDAALMAALLRSTPTGTPLAFIASPAATPTSWDPLVIVMAGFRWLQPRSNVPQFLTSCDSKWQVDVRHWIEQSRVVVCDASEVSSSLATERALVDQVGAQERSIFLTRSPTMVGKGEGSSRQGAVIDYYELSWLRAVPRIAIGCLSAGAAGYAVLQTLGGLVGATIVRLSLAHPSLARESEFVLRKALREVLSSAPYHIAATSEV
jgi:hypothetical protein